MARSLVMMVLCLPVSLNSSSAQESTRTDSQSKPDPGFAGFLRQRAERPVDYVVGKFDSSRVVLLGEVHEVRETCRFVASLIEPLNKAGVKRLCSEFTPSRFNDQLKTIVTGDTYDEEQVIDLFRQSAWATWGYREYMDIVRAVWSVNQARSDGERPFLIVGIDSEWKQAELFNANRQTHFQTIVQREKHMTKLIRSVAFEQNEKVLVHIGFAHTVKQGIRVANELSKQQADQMFQVVMHHELRTRSGPSEITKQLEAAVRDSGKAPCGFDVQGGPFAELRDEKLMLLRAVGKEPVLGAVAQGYVFLRPADRLSKVTWVDGFINESNFKDARTIALKLPQALPVPESAKELDRFFAARFPSP